MKTSYKRGFTLIELLVVIAIIGILSSIVLASLNSARQKGRDARRLGDIKQIQLALELYYDAHSAYPTAALYASNLVSEGFISTLPLDPSSGLSYAYAGLKTGTGTTCTSYHLGALLETSGHSALDSDIDSTDGVVCTSPASGTWAPGNADIDDVASGDFDGTTATAPQVYDVKP